MANRADFSDWESIDLTNIIRNLGQVGLTEVLGAMVEEGEAIMANSKNRVPIRDGILQGSADAVGINVTQDGSKGEVAFGYGGAAAEYSIVQHETPPPGADPDEDYPTDWRFTHTEGQSWKYLEQPVLEAREGMGDRIQSRIRIKREDVS